MNILCQKDGEQKSDWPHPRQTTLKEEKKKKTIKKLQNININRKK